MAENLPRQIDKEVVINPLVIKIGGQEFIQYTSFDIKRSLNDFIDTFTITCDNPGGRYSRDIHCGMSFQVYFSGVEIFRGKIENKSTKWNRVGATVTFSGREEMAELTEDDVDPSIGPFGNTTDNDLLELLTFTFPWKKDFAAAQTIVKYDIAGGSSRKAEVMVDIAKRNNFYLWKKGATLYKRKLPETGSDVVDTFIFSSGVNSRGQWTNKIIEFSTNENIQAVRSKIIGASYSEGKDKTGPTATVENPVIKNGTYHKVIRNLSTQESVLKIDRTRYVAFSSTDIGSVTALVERTIKETNISASLSFTLAGFHDYDLTDTILVDAEPENIYNTFYVSSISYSFKRDNMRTTELTLVPIGYLPV